MSESTESSLGSSKIEEILPIDDSAGEHFKRREDIKKIVERPLVEACERFYDLNIKTIGSSANVKNVGAHGGIEIDYDTLSDSNKAVIEELGLEPKDYTGSKHLQVFIPIPINKESTVLEISNKANEIARKFKPQELRWGRHSKEELAHDYGISVQDIEEMVEGFIQDGYYYDAKTGIFYESEELYKKATGIIPPPLK